MAIRTYKVTLDSKNTIAPEPVFLRQGDKTGAVVINATLMDNGSPVSLSGLTPMFKATTADGQAVIADSTGFSILDSANGEFTYQVPNALSSVPGKITTAYFSFSDSSGSESTFDVAFIIKAAVDITKPQADDYITIIDGTIQSLQQKIDAMNTDIQTILNAYNQGDFYNKAETDSKDAATLTSAKSYADTQDASTLASAKSYADAGDSATLANFTALDAQPYTGFVLSNGATWYGGVGSLVTAELPNGYRIVTIELVLKIASFSAAKGKAIVTLPTKYAPAHELPIEMPCSGGLSARWFLSNRGTIAINAVSDEAVLNTNTWYPFNATYLTHD